MPNLAPATRYFQPGVTKVKILPSIASLEVGATRSEITASTDVSVDVAAINGFGITSNQIDTPDLGTRFTQRIPGRLVAEDASIAFYASLDGEDIRTILSRDQDTYIGIFDGGDVEDRLADYFKVTVASLGKVRDLEDAPRLTVMFTIRAYGENKVIPAAA